MIKVRAELLSSVLVYSVIMGAVFYSKPTLFFTSRGEVKPFGRGSGQSIFPFWLLAIMVALLVYSGVIVSYHRANN